MSGNNNSPTTPGLKAKSSSLGLLLDQNQDNLSLKHERLARIMSLLDMLPLEEVELVAVYCNNKLQRSSRNTLNVPTPKLEKGQVRDPKSGKIYRYTAPKERSSAYLEAEKAVSTAYLAMQDYCRKNDIKFSKENQSAIAADGSLINDPRLNELFVAYVAAKRCFKSLKNP